ncbi:transposase, partial [Sphingobium sp. MK2]
MQWRVIRTIRPKYSCRACEKIVQAPAPVKAIARGKATFGTLAHVVVSKFDHHLPLYRQAEIMAVQGIEIDRSTLAGWVGQASVLLDPIISRIREVGLTASKIHTDDTPAPPCSIRVRVIPTCIDHDARAHLRRPIVMMRHMWTAPSLQDLADNIDRIACV